MRKNIHWYNHFTSYGFWFMHKGDEVEYVWPWKRTKFSNRFISTSFMTFYPSLKALDDEWDGYDRACGACIHGFEDWDECPVCGH